MRIFTFKKSKQTWQLDRSLWVYDGFCHETCNYHTLCPFVYKVSPWFAWAKEADPKGVIFPAINKRQGLSKLPYFVWSPPWHLYIFLLANLLAYFLAFYLAYLLAFYLANLLPFYLAYLLAFYLTYLLAFYLTYFLAFYLAYPLAYILTHLPAYLLA